MSASGGTWPRRWRKFCADPRQGPSTSRSSSQGWRAAKAASSARVASVEPSSLTTSQTGRRCWAAKLSSCASRLAAPL